MLDSRSFSICKRNRILFTPLIRLFRWDENGDGYLDHKEFADAIRLTVRKGQRSKKEYSAKKRAKEIIEKFDHDKDKKLSKEEFIQGQV